MTFPRLARGQLLLAVIRYEVLLQLRSARFRLAAAGYVALCSLPSGLMYFAVRHRSTDSLGSSAYLAQLLQMQPYLTLLMVALIAGNRSGAGALRESWSVLAASPTSNAGYLLRRTLALLVLIVPLSLVPQAVALAAARLAGNESFDAAAWLGTWALWILPAAIFLTGFWLAVVTITGGELAALVATFVTLPLAVSIANQMLLRFHLTLSGYLDFVGYRNLYFWIAYSLQSLGGSSNNRWHSGYAATEAPFDLAAAAAGSLPQWSLVGGLAALGLGLAAAFVRRTRRDLPPRPVPPEHSLRTFLEKLNRWRERYAPDGGLGLPERLAAAAGVIVLGLAFTALLGRQSHFQRLATERYRAETEGAFEPLPATLELATWRIAGRIDRRGKVTVQTASQFENRGSEALPMLAFTLNPALEIDRLEVPRRQLEVARDWDRLQLRLDPPLAAGETLDLEVRLSGVPAAVDFYFDRFKGRFPFPRKYERWHHARFPRDVPNLARSQIRRAASPRRVLLRAADLGPVPRYTPWTLTRRGESRGDGQPPSDYGREVPLESARIVADLELDLEVPAEWLLADTCGHTSHLERPTAPLGAVGQGRLAGSCRTSLTELRVAGGRLVRVDPDGPEASAATIATLPQHRQLAERKLASLARVASLSDGAWPGMPGLTDLVALEWPPEPHPDLRHDMGRWDELGPELAGKLLLIPERMLIDAEPFEPEYLVAGLLSQRLLERRQLAEEQELVFRNLFRALMVRRMGLGGESGATVTGKPWRRQALATPILAAKAGHHYIWRLRLPAVVAEIEGRAGGDNLHGAIEGFLASGGEPGTIEELLAAIEARAGISLERTYQDHFQGGALPILRLEDVAAQRSDGGWRVEGKLRNTGTGQSICPVIVKTEISERVLTVTVDSESATEFTLRTERRPHTVLLDPERTCYRWLLKTSPALERANLLG